MNTFIETASSLYHSGIEWITGHVTLIYIVEITIIGALCLYGFMSENGFRASGY